MCAIICAESTIMRRIKSKKKSNITAETELIKIALLDNATEYAFNNKPVDCMMRLTIVDQDKDNFGAKVEYLHRACIRDFNPDEVIIYNNYGGAIASVDYRELQRLKNEM